MRRTWCSLVLIAALLGGGSALARPPAAPARRSLVSKIVRVIFHETEPAPRTPTGGETQILARARPAQVESPREPELVARERQPESSRSRPRPERQPERKITERERQPERKITE